MGEPAEKLITMEAYLPRVAFEVIGGLATAERFHGMNRKINDTRGPQFWGVRGIKPFENPTTLRTDDLLHRLIDMQHLLRIIPDDPEASEEETADVKKWAFMPAGELKKRAEKTKTIKLVDPERKGKRLGLTNHEAHDTPGIRHIALSTLLEEGDPVINVVKGLEVWRRKNNDYFPLTDDQKILGWQTFEVFLFSAGSERFTEALGYAALEHAQQQK